MSTIPHNPSPHYQKLRTATGRHISILLTILIALLPMAVVADLNEGQYKQALEAYNVEDYETALTIWRNLADQGNSDSQYALGVAYFKGEGIDRDLGKALDWFQLAAKAGNAQAMFNLGAAHWEGNGARQSYSEAVEWWKKAAAVDQHAAQYNLGLAYYLGKGAEQDLNQALNWLRRAVDNGHMGASQVLEVVEKEVSQSEAETINDEQSSEPKDQPALDPSPLNETNPIEVEIISTNYRSAIVSGLGGQAYPDQNPNGTVLANLAGGAPVKIIELEGKWAKVNLPSIASVWVYSKYVHHKDSGISEIRGSRVRARSLPSTDGNSIALGTFENGEQLIILNEKHTWYQVIAPTRIELWMPIQQLELFPNVTNVWLAQWRQAISNRNTESSVSLVYGSDITQSEKNEGAQLDVVSRNAELVSSVDSTKNSFQAAIVSSASAEALGTNKPGAPLLKLLLRGSPVKIRVVRSSWAAIQIAGPVNVWVYGKYVSQQGDIARITGNQVRARSMPSTTPSSTVLGIFKPNTPVKVVSKEGDWLRVSANDVATVWVMLDQLEVLDHISEEWSKLWDSARRSL